MATSSSSSTFVLRPFEGLPGEPDWVAMREVVPAATATARTTAEHGARDVVVTTVLPAGWHALHREDGVVLLALQTVGSSDDTSRALAAALLEALGSEPGTSVILAEPAGPGPRLQDVLDLDVPFEVTVHDGFDYWLAPDVERTRDIEDSLEEAADSIVPTVRLTSVDSAYWCRMNREFVRWALPADEDTVIDAIARLHARRASGLAGGRFVGAFRSSGIVVPVWELPRGTEAADVEGPAAELKVALDAALADDSPLTADERRARAGIVARQVTLR